jgi:subtilase family serine protease
VRLQIEELEMRALLSASSLTTPVAPPTNTNWASPQVTLLPVANPDLGGTGRVTYTPAQIQKAYGFDQTKLSNGQLATGSGQTIAIIDAYYDPTAQSDLNSFDSKYGIAAPTSFQQIRMNGVTTQNTGWS